ncbi:MAG: hypothetical protein EOM91_04645 [Sphingobacteriia bacterium]|nr:hypothetical protein [Sphingobacteriia bacterium]NCC39092.1 hypothetical protein [Gammaproteobacteria bacterium]
MSTSVDPTPATTPDATRALLYYPVIHSLVDLGALRASVESAAQRSRGAEAWRERVRTIDQMWDEIERSIETLVLDPTRVRLYQDGLPICDHVHEIVRDMAEKGGRNHQILQRLRMRGATLMGTESPDLLLQEYDLAKRLLGADQASLGGDQRDALQMQARTLLKARDRVIAERINDTLLAGETGILFLGMLHDVNPWLDATIRVEYPIGRPSVTDRPDPD